VISASEVCVVALVGVASGWLVLAGTALRRGAPRREWLNAVASGVMLAISLATVAASGDFTLWALGAGSLLVGVIASTRWVRRGEST